MTEAVETPWGSYRVLDEGPRYKVKLLFVRPGASTSLQFHRHRQEMWTVVHGTADVRINEKQGQIHESAYAYIGRSEIHRLTNNGKIDLYVIEVQTGSYLGEDDIERLEDAYGRAKPIAR